jgi:hypothetical protein
VSRVRWRWIVTALALLALLIVAVGIVWLATPQPTLPEADLALASTNEVTVQVDDGRLTFTPVEGTDTGLIVYPGGRVPPKAYAPLAHEIAAQGYLVVVVPMPFNLAVLGVGSATQVIADHPEIKHWAIGGHSLGGAMAAQYAADNPELVDGLALWAAYSPADLSASGLAAAVIYGTLDEGRDSFTSTEALSQLPPDATVSAIEGGNHAGFGWYTGQPNDPPATITREEQQSEAALATLELLRLLQAR